MAILCENTGKNAVFGESAGDAAGAMEAVETAHGRPLILPVPISSYEFADEEKEKMIGWTNSRQ
jgi:ABC-type sugar transport system substrate-binding protein